MTGALVSHSHASIKEMVNRCLMLPVCHLFGCAVTPAISGEAVVMEGTIGREMFIVLSGAMVVLNLILFI